MKFDLFNYYVNKLLFYYNHSFYQSVLRLVHINLLSNQILTGFNTKIILSCLPNIY